MPIYENAPVIAMRKDDYDFAHLHAKLKRGIIAAYDDQSARYTVVSGTDDILKAETLGRLGEIAFMTFAIRHRLYFTDHASQLSTESKTRREHIDFTMQSGPLSGRTIDVKTSPWQDWPALFVGGSTAQVMHQQQHPDLYLFVQIDNEQDRPRARFVGYISSKDMLVGEKLRPGGAHGNPQIPIEYLHPVADLVPMPVAIPVARAPFPLKAG